MKNNNPILIFIAILIIALGLYYVFMQTDVLDGLLKEDRGGAPVISPETPAQPASTQPIPGY